MEMEEIEDQQSSKSSSVDLRVIFLGELGVGKKSLINRFKFVNSSETKSIDFNGFYAVQKKSKTYPTKKTDKSHETSSNQKSKKDTTLQSEETVEQETEEDKLYKRREENRINCMRFSKIYNLGFNNLTITYYPCAEEQPLPYDYELREDDEFYQFEKQYKISIKQLVKEIEKIIIKPAPNSRTRVEILFVLTFDLSNFASFEKLMVYFSQIERHFKFNENDYKMILLGNKMDKRVNMKKDQKDKFEKFRSKYSLNYYEASSLIFFNFEIFFEKIVIENFGNLAIFNEFRNKFHDIIHTKKSFTKTKRPPFGGDDNPPANKYDNNPYQYPTNEKDFKKMFKDHDKYNKHIFVNKQSMVYPPIKSIDKDTSNIENARKKGHSSEKNMVFFSWDSTQNESVKAALELQCHLPGYTLGMKTYKPLGLFQERERLRKKMDEQKIEALGGNIDLMEEKRTLTEGNIEANQQKYELNRKNNRDRILEERKMVEDNLKSRHDNVNEKNNEKFNNKIQEIKDRQNKYDKIFEEREKSKEKKRMENIVKNNIKIIPKYEEPKCRLYDPVSSIATNRGFTFGKKYFHKEIDVGTPDFATFKDDFEKLIDKNKKRVILKPTVSLKSESKTLDIEDRRKFLDKMKMFENRRKNNKKNMISPFLMDRKNKKDIVSQKKIDIKNSLDKNFEEQIKKTYKDDMNYLLRNINYNQVEQSSPSFSMKGKYDFGGAFYIEKEPQDLSSPKRDRKIILENPDFGLIRPHYPAFSFGTSKRFKSLEVEGRTSDNKNKNIKTRYDTDKGDNYDNWCKSLYFYGSQDSQSFLKTQTMMGTGKKMVVKDNGYPAPNRYTIRGFADDIKSNGDKINATRMMLIEKKKLEDIEKINMAKLREERYEEKRRALKMSLKDSFNFKELAKNKDMESENKEVKGDEATNDQKTIEN